MSAPTKADPPQIHDAGVPMVTRVVIKGSTRELLETIAELLGP